MRLPYVPNPPEYLKASEEQIVQRILARRGNRGLVSLDRTLLHSPPVADGWNSLLGAIRTQTSLPTDIREIAICRVGVINEAWFEWAQHAPILVEVEGFTEEMLAIVRRPMQDGGRGPLSERQWVVLRYADAMTRNVKVEDGLFEELGTKGGFGDREIVELTATIAAYNCVSRFLVALNVGEMNGKELK